MNAWQIAEEDKFDNWLEFKNSNIRFAKLKKKVVH